MAEPESRYDEKRSEPRHEKMLAIVGTVLRCAEDPSLEGCPIQCETINISGHGMQFASDVLLTRGTLLRIAIAYRPKEVFSVEGEVRWSKEEDGKPIMGIELHDNEETDFQHWSQLIEFEMIRTKPSSNDS